MDLYRLDSDAVRSIQRLGARGHEAYLVGGCVRDLLLDRDPKDFDLATGARPQQVKRAFPRNCRIIGRRFKLAHLHFDGNQKILEVATFRSSPRAEDEEIPEDDLPEDELEAVDEADDTETDDFSDDDDGDDRDDGDDEDDDDADDESADLLILRDNEFGTIEEDALRRDFTINALFLDPVRDEIIDYVGGMEDVEAHLIRTIGDPETRFREDPIRILRAVKFAGRLSFTFEPATGAAMRKTAPDLVRAAPPRILEEILRLLRGGHALPSFQILRDIDGLAALLPRVSEYLDAANDDERRVFWRLLEALDNHIHNGRKPSNAVLLGCLFLLPILRLLEDGSGRSPASIAEEVIGPLARDLRLPRRDTGALKRICSVQGRFTATGKRRFRLASFLQDPHVHEALELFELACIARGEDFDDLERWTELIAEEAPPPEVAASGGRERQQKKAAKHKRKRDRDREPRKRDGRKTEGRKSEGRKKDGRKGEGRKKPAAERKGKRKSKQEEVLTIEPEAIDVSAFDRELGHREVPTFDTIVETAGSGKARKRVKMTEDDSYKPPPPPGGGDAPPPPPAPSSDDVFGDW